jgi:hypothetical protein
VDENKEIYLPDTTITYGKLKKKLKEVYNIDVSHNSPNLKQKNFIEDNSKTIIIVLIVLVILFTFT